MVAANIHTARELESDQCAMTESRQPKSQLSPVESLAAFNRLISDSTNSTSEKDFINSLLNVPILLDAIQNVSGNLNEDSVEAWYRFNKPFDMAFNHASLALSAAGDALLALYSQVIVGKSVTSYSPLVLLRYACESALLSRWLLNDLSAQEILRRGFAIEWKNAKEANTFHNNLIASNSARSDAIGGLKERAEKRLESTMAIGLEYKLLREYRGEMVPIYGFPGPKELFKDVNTSTQYNDMVWIYNLMSGVSHSLEWALMSVVHHSVKHEYERTDSSGEIHKTGVIHHRNDPNLELFTFPLHLAVLQVSEAIQNFSKANQTSA